MKRLMALSLALLLSLALFAGCKKDAGATPTTTGVPGSSQTVGSFTLFVPDGWTPVQKENKVNQVYLCKGQGNLSQESYIKLNDGGVLPPEGICTEVTEIPTQTCGSLSWNGFSGKKSQGNVIYLVTKTDSSSILATLWYTQDILSLEDAAVQAILGGVSVAAPAEPEAAPSEPEASSTSASIIGDWSGQAEFIDCTGDFESQGGAVCKAIARILTDENGNITPFIGLAEEGGTITNLTTTAATEEMAPQISGKWNGNAFDNADFTVVDGKLLIQIFVNTEGGDALLQMTMSPATDFEAQAQQLGFTGYPTK